MRVKTFIVTVLWLLGSVFVLADLSLAKEENRLRAKLEPCCGTDSDAEGKAERRERLDKPRDRFKATVEIPIPSPGLGILTPEDARAADIFLSLSNETDTYAECLLELDDPEEVTDVAEYKVDLRKRGEILRQKKGTCDTDLVAGGIQAGIPDVQDGDLATVSIVNPEPVPFLEGTFRLK